ncbi:MAG: F0F1 ATP synthase subunit epsilon [Burkholderiaceae bacterium]|nr:F0F1 ATP synthase subunit epsilon [Burkholderiaceae bacterium]
MAKLDVEVVTGERSVLTETDVDMVIVPGADGSLGILPQHAPLISTLATGELRIKKGTTEESIVVFGGFVEVTPHKVIILADTAERTEEIDVARAEAARRRAEQALAAATDKVNLAEAEASLRRAVVRLKLAETKRRGRQA